MTDHEIRHLLRVLAGALLLDGQREMGDVEPPVFRMAVVTGCLRRRRPSSLDQNAVSTRSRHKSGRDEYSLLRLEQLQPNAEAERALHSPGRGVDLRAFHRAIGPVQEQVRML